MEKKKEIPPQFYASYPNFVSCCIWFCLSQIQFRVFYESIRENDTASFSRDHEEKYKGKASYKITNEEYSDALFYQTVSVTPHTSYRVSCNGKTSRY